MILHENFAAQTHHFELAKRAQIENPFTTQNQVVELQKAALASQAKSQSVSENKNNSSSSQTKEKQTKDEFISYGKDGISKSRNLTNTGSRFDSLA